MCPGVGGTEPELTPWKAPPERQLVVSLGARHAASEEKPSTTHKALEPQQRPAQQAIPQESTEALGSW